MESQKGTVILKFQSLPIMEGGQEKTQLKAENGNPLFEREDVLALRTLLNIVELSTLNDSDERQYVNILEKVNDKWRKEKRDCEIEFTNTEALWLYKYLLNVKSMARIVDAKGTSAAIMQTPFCSVCKVSLRDQLESQGVSV